MLDICQCFYRASGFEERPATAERCATRQMREMVFRGQGLGSFGVAACLRCFAAQEMTPGRM